MCETLNDKHVRSEYTCFGITLEIAAVRSRVLSYLGTGLLSVVGGFLNIVLNE